MHRLAVNLYHRLPPPMRSVAASWHGARLRRWRYGRDTDRLVAEALERDAWTADRWAAWREDRLARVLHRAATRVPYYRDLWSHRRAAGDRRSWERLEHWPLLTKDALRTQALRFVADDCRVSQMFHEHTSGTSGKALDLWWSRATVRAWYALFEARCRVWSGVSRHDRWAILGGQLVVPAAQAAPPFWVWNAALHQLYMSTYHLSPAAIPAYLQALASYRVSYLWGYSSALYELAAAALRAGITPPPLKVVITNAEPLLDWQRQTIARAFACPVRETYGMAEIVAASSECSAGSLHEWPEVGIAELVDDDGRTTTPGEAGSLVATGLLNSDMPLIRYAVGDRLSMPAVRADRCACGRALPIVSAIDGRCDDTVLTRDGRRIGRLDPIFKSGLPIAEAQIVQESFDRLRVRYVPDASFSLASETALRTAIRERVGEMELVLEPLARIPRSANGKFRAVLCEIPMAERRGVPA
jgi:phenylacetate-CoA ligase